VKSEPELTVEHMHATVREIEDAIARRDWAAVKMSSIDLGLLAAKQKLAAQSQVEQGQSRADAGRCAP
jgi:2-oxo-4-hydroxy-4-carboxy--5-ureidoimidazoline (OHCU) decarboxylase